MNRFDKSQNDEVLRAAKNGDVQSLMSKLTPQQTEQLKKVLSDESAAKKLLATPQAQAVLRSLGKK